MKVTLTLKDGTRYAIENVIPGEVRFVDQTSEFFDRANCNRVEIQCFGNEPAAHNGVASVELEQEEFEENWDVMGPRAKEAVRGHRS